MQLHAEPLPLEELENLGVLDGFLLRQSQWHVLLYRDPLLLLRRRRPWHVLGHIRRPVIVVLVVAKEA
jgi:hypothetical protein